MRVLKDQAEMQKVAGGYQGILQYLSYLQAVRANDFWEHRDHGPWT